MGKKWRKDRRDEKARWRRREKEAKEKGGKVEADFKQEKEEMESKGKKTSVVQQRVINAKQSEHQVEMTVKSRSSRKWACSRCGTEVRLRHGDEAIQAWMGSACAKAWPRRADEKEEKAAAVHRGGKDQG